MSPEECRLEFLVRFYQWSIDEWSHEIQMDLATLRSIQGPVTARAVEMMEAFPRHEQQEVARALLKRFHPEAAAHVGDASNEHEHTILLRCDELRRQPSRWESKVASAIPLGAKQVAQLLKDALAFLGRPRGLGSGQWTYVSDHGPWALETQIDTGRRQDSFSYSHDILLPGTVPIRLVSVTSWLGLGGSTKWRVFSETEGAAAAQCVATLCRRFETTFHDLTTDLIPAGVA